MMQLEVLLHTESECDSDIIELNTQFQQFKMCKVPCFSRL